MKNTTGNLDNLVEDITTFTERWILSPDLSEVVASTNARIQFPLRSGNITTIQSEIHSDYDVLFTSKRWKRKVIDRTNEKSDSSNSPMRELSILLSTWDGEFLVDSPQIRNLYMLLIRSVLKTDAHDILWSIWRYCDNKMTIDNSHMPRDNTRSEDMARSKYNEFKNAFALTSEEDQHGIIWVSWEDREHFRNLKNYCRLWVLKMCIINLIKFE